MTDADHGILMSKISFLREAEVVKGGKHKFWIQQPLILPTELKRMAAKVLALTGSKEAPHAKYGWVLNLWVLLAGQFLLEKVMLPNGRRVWGGSSTCWWKHNLMLILVL